MKAADNAVNLPAFDFVGFARICGVRGFKADTPGEFAAAFVRALNHQGPTAIVANISPHQMVDPMVQPGRTVDQFVFFDQAK
ncbi:MAG: thiamine pyrophosphate-dependent enzyme [Negativicutes bacterium]